ncbi:hypothetical protein [Roseovarius nanhaiticus]|uniref:hypothetical protein n=1 Tax=Roseovarius nanhaiticus TaxID=573024 RepID=UPI00249278B8|nr:hypothetical protein [Roseovarius nanhaiticus]
MAPRGGTDLKFTLYGLEHHSDGEVDGEVFAAKLKKLISGLKRLDRDYNTAGQHRFMISNLEFASATVVLREKVMKPRSVRKSPSQRFAEIGAAANSAIPFEVENAADEYALGVYKSLSTGAGKTFSYGVVDATEIAAVRLDKLLKTRVENIISRAIDAANNAEPKYFCGVSYDTHDGTMKLVDLRGLFPEAKLVLSAGGKEVSCVVTRSDVEMLRKSLDRRVLVTGQSQYDGHSMVPSRIDVTNIKIIDLGHNILEFCGSLKNANPSAIEEIG